MQSFGNSFAAAVSLYFLAESVDRNYGTILSHYVIIVVFSHIFLKACSMRFVNTSCPVLELSVVSDDNCLIVILYFLSCTTQHCLPIFQCCLEESTPSDKATFILPILIDFYCQEPII